MAFNYADYLASLLIIQYHNKPRASATIKALAQMFPVDLIFAIRDGFSLDTATGKQLDILAKYIQVDRHYTNASSQPAELTDDEFRVLLKLKAICNTGNATLYGIDKAMYDFFGTEIRVRDNRDNSNNYTMSFTYYIHPKWSNVGRAAIQQDVFPRPVGVGITYNVASLTKYFGFVDYNNQNHPFSTGFRDYEDTTKEGEMFKYDSVIE